ncbi:oligosaccharide flippase family protein [Bacillus cereus]|uniref:Oligosaccharide translocase (Flippase) n=1 Tax=Bacillus cereus VD184 TaxID=1053242 RepID=A0A9W5R5L2_BACCE|nr:oligosaccharide flippase family protein [Bacillus cereus]EOQ11105.1 hypothetical protein IKC_05704 [Bacillus cereus VD184]
MRSTFLKKLFLLMSGTVLGQLIIFVSSPLLTRFYSPADFGVLSIYTSVLSFLLVLGSLRYEMAILIARNDSEAIQLVVLSTLILFVSSMSLLIGILVIAALHVHHVQLVYISKYMYLLPSGLFFMGLYNVALNWSIRNSHFHLITKTKLSQSIWLTLSTLLMGLLNFKSWGLILGDLIGKGSGSVAMFRKFTHHISWRVIVQNIKISRLLETMKTYKQYPLLMTWSSLFNVAGIYLSPMLFTLFFDSTVGGHFSFGHRVVGAPLLLIGQSISQVYVSTFPKQKYPLQLFKKTIMLVSLIGIVISIILFLFGEHIFHLAFGEGWRKSGEYVSILAFMYLFYMIAFPVSQTLIMLQKQLLQLLWDVSRVIFLVVLFCSVSIFSFSDIVTLQIYSIGMGVFYLILLLLIYRTLHKISKKDLW